MMTSERDWAGLHPGGARAAPTVALARWFLSQTLALRRTRVGLAHGACGPTSLRPPGGDHTARRRLRRDPLVVRVTIVVWLDGQAQGRGSL